MLPLVHISIFSLFKRSHPSYITLSNSLPFLQSLSNYTSNQRSIKMCESTVHEYQKCGCATKDRSLCKKKRCKPTVTRQKHPQKCPKCCRNPTEASSRHDLDKEYDRKSRMEEIDNRMVHLKARQKYLRESSSDTDSTSSRSSASSRDSTLSDYVSSSFDDELTPSDSVTSIGSRPSPPRHTSKPSRNIEIIFECDDYDNTATFVESEDRRGRTRSKHRPPPPSYSDDSEYSSRERRHYKRPPPPPTEYSSVNSSYKNSTNSRFNDGRSQISYATGSSRPSSYTISRSRTPPPPPHSHPRPPPSHPPPRWIHDPDREVHILRNVPPTGTGSTVRGIDKRDYLIIAPAGAPEGID